MAFLTDPRSREPAISAPPVVWLLVAVLMGIELSREFLWAGASPTIDVEYGFMPALYSNAWLAAHGVGSISALDRVIPFVSYMFLHGGFAHVAVNSVWLLAFGAIVARRLGTPLFLLFFLVCGVLAAATHLAVNWGLDAPMVGASGAISGLMAAGIRMIDVAAPWNRAANHPLAPILSRQVLSFTIFWVAANVLAGITGLGAGPGVQLIAWQAHLGGYAAGLLLIGLFDRFRPVSDEPAAEPLV
jgi:membrane associated rhomboid family serine protease